MYKVLGHIKDPISRRGLVTWPNTGDQWRPAKWHGDSEWWSYRRRWHHQLSVWPQRDNKGTHLLKLKFEFPTLLMMRMKGNSQWAGILKMCKRNLLGLANQNLAAAHHLGYYFMHWIQIQANTYKYTTQATKVRKYSAPPLLCDPSIEQFPIMRLTKSGTRSHSLALIPLVRDHPSCVTASALLEGRSHKRGPLY